MQDTEFVLGAFQTPEPVPAAPQAPAAPPAEPPTDPPTVPTKDSDTPPSPPAEPGGQGTEPQAPAGEPTPSENVWFNLAKSFQVADKILPEDVEIPEDLDGPGLKELLKGAVRTEVLSEPDTIAAREAETKKLLEKGWTAEQIEEGRRVAEALAANIEPAEIQELSYLEQMEQYVPATDELRLEYVKRAFLEAGQDELLVDNFLKTNFGDLSKQEQIDALAQLEEKARESFKTMRSSRLEAVQAEAQQRKEAIQKEIEDERKAVERALDSGVYGLRLDKNDKAKLLSAMYETDGYETVEGPDGPQRVPFTKESKAMREMFRSPEKRALLAYIAVNGVENFVTMASKKATDGFLRTIATNEIPQPPGASARPEPVMPDTQARQTVSGDSFTIPFST